MFRLEHFSDRLLGMRMRSQRRRDFRHASYPLFFGNSLDRRLLRKAADEPVVLTEARERRDRSAGKSTALHPSHADRPTGSEACIRDEIGVSVSFERSCQTIDVFKGIRYQARLVANQRRVQWAIRAKRAKPVEQPRERLLDYELRSVLRPLWA